MPAIVVQFGAVTLSTSPISKLRAADDERRQAMREIDRAAGLLLDAPENALEAVPS